VIKSRLTSDCLILVKPLRPKLTNDRWGDGQALHALLTTVTTLESGLELEAVRSSEQDYRKQI